MKNYFETAGRMANESYSNFGGGGGDWSNFGASNDPYNYANGGGQDAAASLPYIINVANSTASDVSDVQILGANSATFGATNFGNAAAITITMDNGDVTYTEFLESIKSTPFKVGLMYIQSSNTSQPFKQITVEYRNANGRKVTFPINPALDPMQNQAGVTIVRTQFAINAFTKMLTTILASATLTLRLYPMDEIDVSRTLSGQNAGKGYIRPNLSQFQVPTQNPLVGR
jgi:hypothetical protein